MISSRIAGALTKCRAAASRSGGAVEPVPVKLGSNGLDESSVFDAVAPDFRRSGYIYPGPRRRISALPRRDSSQRLSLIWVHREPPLAVRDGIGVLNTALGVIGRPYEFDASRDCGAPSSRPSVIVWLTID